MAGKISPPVAFEIVPYQGTVRDDLIQAAHTNEFLNAGVPLHGVHEQNEGFANWQKKDLEATVKHLEVIGDYTSAAVLRQELERYGPVETGAEFK